MTDSIFPGEALASFASAYPNRPLKLAHRLLAHELLTLDALAGLAAALPDGSVEHNPGDLPIGIAPGDVPKGQLGVVETIRTIERSGAWVVLKRIEQVPAYAGLLHALLAQIEPVVRPLTGAMLQPEGFVFVTSPGSVTPFHFDPEHNILLQVRGSKTMTLFQVADETLAPPEVHEAFHLGQHHRNLAWRDEYEPRGEAIAIAAGEAIHVPVKAPHWVRNGPEVSVSLSITWRSEWSFAEADARAFNHLLRRLGLHPRSPRPFPRRNLAKSLSHRALRRLRAGLRSSA